MTVDSAPRPSIFVSYSHQDEDLVSEFKKQLDHLQVPVWYDRDIPPGTKVEEAIRQGLDEAAIILLLVSPNFIASHYCYGIELQRALERHRAGQAQVIPVLLRAVDWRATPLADLQCLPRSGKPLVDWPNRDEAFRDVTGDIRIEVLKCLLTPRVRREQMSLTEARVLLDKWLSRKPALREEFEKFELELLSDDYPPSMMAPSRYPYIRRWLGTDGEEGEELLLFWQLWAELYKHARHDFHFYNNYLRIDPSNAILHLRKGEALFGLGRYQEALTAYEEAIHLDPSLSEAYKGRGRVYERLAQQTFEGLKRQAQECYEKAKELGIS